MKVHLTAADSANERSLCHIVPLFFEDPVVTFGPGRQADADVIVELISEDRGTQAYASAVLTVAGGAVYSSEQAGCLTAGSSPEERRKTARQTVSRALVDVLTQATGLVQPWGILTGVRPTKLLHDGLRRGLPREEVRRVLREDYLVTDGKIALMEKIVDRQLQAIPDLYGLRDEVSVYIGIPFCPTKCAYCTFPAYDINGRQGSVNGFLHGLHEEIRVIGRWFRDNGVKITTVYFGGGTPTSISAEEMDALYAEMQASFPEVDGIRELTVEAGRPDTITPEKLEVLKKWNIHRISINPQSYIQETLELIGRHHTVEETVDKFLLARNAGMDNINMDLIIGLPGEGPTEFAHTLAGTAKLLPESLTVHTLSFKRASEMTQHRGDAKYRVAGRDEIGTMMADAVAWTARHGYEPYYLYRQKNILGNLENVGYALPGMDSLYNILIIEEMQTIVGLGCGATSKWIDAQTGEISRLANPKEPKAYIDTYRNYIDLKLEALDKWNLSRRRMDQSASDREYTGSAG